MNLNEYVKKLQRAMNAAGSKLTEDGDFGPVSQAEADKYAITVAATRKQMVAPEPNVGGVVNPAYVEAKKYAGRGERDAGFVKWLAGFWPKVGLPGYKTIIGSSFAWCGLFIAAMNSEVGQKWAAKAAGARNWAVYGQAIDWRANGIPRGAVMHLNHEGNCSSKSDNHVTFADGDCSAADLAKPGANVPGYGGNQSNATRRSMYPVKEVCAVRWPAEIALPAAVAKSDGCSGAASGESTR